MLIILIYYYKPKMTCFSAINLCLDDKINSLSYNINAYTYYNFNA